jgi:hypothetical protein
MHTHALTFPEERERELVGGDPAHFFALAQRCVWGVSEPGLVRVDLRRVIARLRTEFPTLFAAHLLAAFALRSPFAGRLKYFAFELIDRIGWLSYHPTLWRLRSLQACLQRVASAPYTLVTGAHWPVLPCGRAGFDDALKSALSLSPWQHKRLVARYFWQQPGFLVDFVRYATKSA